MALWPTRLILKGSVPVLHAYRLIYPDSPHAPEMLWEWEEPYIHMLIQNARTFHREVVQCDFPTWGASLAGGRAALDGQADVGSSTPVRVCPRESSAPAGTGL